MLQRYCHLFVRGELEGLVEAVNREVAGLRESVGTGGDGGGLERGR